VPYLAKTQTLTTLLQNIKAFCLFIYLNVLYFWKASGAHYNCALSFRPVTAHSSKISSKVVQINLSKDFPTYNLIPISHLPYACYVALALI
jgi:hypothetical protein